MRDTGAGEGYEPSGNHPRPLLLGYVREDALATCTDLPALEAYLELFAEREEFSLGTVYVARGTTPGAFHALLDDLERNETAWGIVVPNLGHVTDEEHLLMRRHQRDGGRTTILVAHYSHKPVGLATCRPSGARPTFPAAPKDPGR